MILGKKRSKISILNNQDKLKCLVVVSPSTSCFNGGEFVLAPSPDEHYLNSLRKIAQRGLEQQLPYENSLYSGVIWTKEEK